MEPGELGDHSAYEVYYRNSTSDLSDCASPTRYVAEYFARYATPFAQGGSGFDGEVLEELLKRVEIHMGPLATKRRNATILDAGCGLGELSVYLACKGYEVIGVDAATSGVEAAVDLASKIGVTDNCRFVAASLLRTGIDDGSVDVIVGRHSLQNFIRYRDIVKEFQRISRGNALWVFMDCFGENAFKNLFHDKRTMQRLGDGALTKRMIEDFFAPLEVRLEPFTWFGLLDKLYSKVLRRRRRSGRTESLIRRLSRLHFWLDQHVPKRSRTVLWFAGHVITEVTPK